MVQEKLLTILIFIISLLLIALIASWAYFVMYGHGTLELVKLEQQSLLLLLFGGLTALFAVIFFIAVLRGDAPLVETHWGGIGGSLGGWRLSKSLVYFLGALAFGAMAVVTLDDGVGDVPAQPAASTQAATTK